MRILIILLAALLLATPARADFFVARNGDDSLRIDTDTDCASAVIIALETHVGPGMLKAGVAVVAGQKYDVCWHPMGNQVHVRYEDGDHGLIPGDDFAEDPGV